VMSEDARAGTVAVELSGGVGEITELRLDEALRRRNLGVRLVGQAVSHARANGCDTLRAEPPKGDELAWKRLREYGFAEQDGALVKYIGYDEAYRVRRFEEAILESKKDG